MQKKQPDAGSPHGKLPAKPPVTQPQTSMYQPQIPVARAHKTPQDKGSAAAKKSEPGQAKPESATQRTAPQPTHTVSVKDVQSPDPVRTVSGGNPLASQALEPGGAPGVTSPAYPCLCPDEKYPITRSVCLGRQERNYEKCLGCEHLIKERRPRKSDFKER